jgi:hypothetical protein
MGRLDMVRWYDGVMYDERMEGWVEKERRCGSENREAL